MTPFKALTDIVVHGCIIFKAGDQVDALCSSYNKTNDPEELQDAILTRVDHYSLIIPKKFLIKLVD